MDNLYPEYADYASPMKGEIIHLSKIIVPSGANVNIMVSDRNLMDDFSNGRPKNLYQTIRKSRLRLDWCDKGEVRLKPLFNVFGR